MALVSYGKLNKKGRVLLACLCMTLSFSGLCGCASAPAKSEEAALTAQTAEQIVDTESAAASRDKVGKSVVQSSKSGVSSSKSAEEGKTSAKSVASTTKVKSSDAVKSSVSADSGTTTSGKTPSKASGKPDFSITHCPTPVASGKQVAQNSAAIIDFSNTGDGYICVKYIGQNPKVKLRVLAPDGMLYTYDLHGGDYEVFPLSTGDGKYAVTVYESISVARSSYAVCLFKEIDVKLDDEFAPFLCPNQYVNFNEDSKAVVKSAELAADADDELELITNVYNYITDNISYDYDKAKTPPTNYVTDLDEIMDSGKGICLDYAALMAAMLRSRGIPTRLEVGYARDVYHAWISVYVDEMGWLNGIISFDGSSWTLVDPTFGATSASDKLKKFIGDGSNYVTQKLY